MTNQKIELPIFRRSPSLMRAGSISLLPFKNVPCRLLLSLTKYWPSLVVINAWKREIEVSSLMTISFWSSRPSLHSGATTGIFLLDSRMRRKAAVEFEFSLLIFIIGTKEPGNTDYHMQKNMKHRRRFIPEFLNATAITSSENKFGEFNQT